MGRVFYWLIFKLLSLVFQFFMTIEILVNQFIRYVYIPIIIPTNNPQKIINDIAALEKKPNDQVTFMVQIKHNKQSDIARTALKIIRYEQIISQAVTPKQINCVVSTHSLSEADIQQFKQAISSMKPKSSELKLYFSSQMNYMQKLKVQKQKITPLVLSFCSYPSISCLHPQFLIGAQISFIPPILKSCDYDILASFQRYSLSNQRKGK